MYDYNQCLDDLSNREIEPLNSGSNRLTRLSFCIENTLLSLESRAPIVRGGRLWYMLSLIVSVHSAGA